MAFRFSRPALRRILWRTPIPKTAAEHDRYYTALHRIHDWFRDLWFGAGPEAEALRTRTLPKIAEDSSRVPDFIAVGPEAPSDEIARRRMFSED